MFPAGTTEAGAGPEEGGQDGAGLRASVCRVLSTKSCVYVVVLQQP